MPWWNIYLSDDVDEASNLLTKNIAEVIDKHAPMKAFQVRKNFAPWLTSATKEKMKERDSAMLKANSNKDPEDKRFYRNVGINKYFLP